MNKKLLSLLLAAIMLLSVVPFRSSASAADDVKHIIVTYDTLGITPADLGKVQDAVNARTIPEIGVEVEFKAVSAYDAFALFPTWIGTGERVDLMMPLLQDLRTYADQDRAPPRTAPVFGSIRLRSE